MLDINYIRENIDKVKSGVSNKGYSIVAIDEVLDLDKKVRELVGQVDGLRAERNTAASEKDIEKGKEIKSKLPAIEQELEKIRGGFLEKLNAIPNLPFEDVPEGSGEKDNKVLKEIGEVGKPNFSLKDHVELGEILDILDFERGSKVAGAGFYYLKNEGVLLELALIQYGLNFLREKGFTVMITPDLAREKFYLGTGYSPKGPEAQIYKIEESDLGLIATSEVTLAGLHSDEVIVVPKKYAGFSHCFRMEAGGYGKYSKGLYRVHQFSKVEMFVYSSKDESQKIHGELLNLEEEFWQSLGIPYRVLEMCAGDLGAQAAKKYDLEAYMPGRGEYGEVTSTSNTTDYQARRLGIKYRDGNEDKFAHTLNGTLVAIPRAIIAILENFQQEDGSVKIPEVLQKYTGFSEIRPK